MSTHPRTILDNVDGVWHLRAVWRPWRPPRLVGASITQHGMLVDSYPHMIVHMTLPGTEITMGPMATAGLPASAIRGVPRMAAPISPSSMESPILKSTKDHGPGGGHTGIGMGMSSGGISPTEQLMQNLRS